MKKIRRSGSMWKIDLAFAFILVWSLASTTLLVLQRRRNDELERQLDAADDDGTDKMDRLGQKFRDSKNLMGKLPKAHRNIPVGENEESKTEAEIVGELVLSELNVQLMNKDNDAGRHGLGQAALKTNQFPFVRSLENFRRSNSFYIYIVNSHSVSPGQQSLLEWREVAWKKLVEGWGRDTTFDGLREMAAPVKRRARVKAGKPGEFMRKKLVLHCLPKTASTTLRRACYRNMVDECSDNIELPKQQDPYGYRNIDEFFHAVKECEDVDHYCVQGGDAGMRIIDYDLNATDAVISNLEREPLHFVHMVPFRNYDDWVESAISHIFYIDKTCDRVDKLLDQCLGYRELYWELYPKAVLSLLIGMTFYANGKGLNREDKHHIVLYNYKDVDEIVSEVSVFFGMDPLPRTNQRKKQKKGDEETCPSSISEKFHECHDDNLMRADAIRGMKAERTRRRVNDRAMKKILMCMKNDNCNDKDQSKDGSEN
ncbi:hypothetical protein ACHAWF_014101 [Thalassiosira exigua]